MRSDVRGKELDGLISRCQLLAGEIATSARPLQLAEKIRRLAIDTPMVSDPRTRLAVHTVLSHALAHTARAIGIAGRAEFASAFIEWIATSVDDPNWSTDLCQVTEQCARTLEAEELESYRSVSGHDLRIVRIRNLIEHQHADPHLTLNVVAEAAGLSIWHTMHLLKKHTGHTFKALIHQARIGSAQSLLRQTTLSIKEIAIAVGYASSSEFGRHFHRYAGVTPGDFRRTCWHSFGQLAATLDR